MGEALGTALVAGLAVIFLLGLLGITSLCTGLAAIFVHGAARTVLLCISGVCALPVVGSILYETLDIEYRVYEHKYKRENSALVLAVEDCDLNKVEKLLKRKKNPNEMKNERLPLITAFNLINKENMETSDKIVGLLLQYGADVNLGAKKGPGGNYVEPDYNYVDWETYPLKCAIDAKRVNAARMFVEHGANIDSIKTKKIQEYIDKGVKEEDIPYEDKIYSFRPVQYAIEKNSFECAKYFLDEGANYTVSFGGSYTCFMELMRKKYIEDNGIIIEIFDKLLECFPDEEKIELLNRKDDNGRTALHHFTDECRRSENTRLLSKLLEYKIKMNETDSEGKTPLHYAVESYFSYPEYLETIYPIIQLLIQNGSNINIRDGEGKLPVDIFRECYKETDNETYRKIEKLLLPARVSKIPDEAYSYKVLAYNDHAHLEDPLDNW